MSGNAALFDSEHRHANFITLSISRAERTRKLSGDRIYGREELIEVAMSEAQWAAMISSLNFGSGVPATLQHLMCQRVDPPTVEDRTTQFEDEMSATLAEAVRKLGALKKGKLTKTQQRDIDLIIQEIASNVPFVARQFDEHMETRVQKARSDIEAHMNAAAQRAGLAALLAPDDSVLQIEDHADDVR